MSNQKVFITKYALTKGILEEVLDLKEDGKSCWGKPKGWAFNDVFYGDDFHLTIEEAKKDSETRRLKKIESLKKQMKKLEKLSFK